MILYDATLLSFKVTLHTRSLFKQCNETIQQLQGKILNLIKTKIVISALFLTTSNVQTQFGTKGS